MAPRRADGNGSTETSAEITKRLPAVGRRSPGAPYEQYEVRVKAKNGEDDDVTD